MARIDHGSPSRVAQALSRTSRQGILLEGVVAVSTASLLIVLAGRMWPGSGSSVFSASGLAAVSIVSIVSILTGLILVRRWTPLRAARLLERENPELQQGLLAWTTAPDSALHGALESWLLARPLRARHARLRAVAALSVLTAGLVVVVSRTRAPGARPAVAGRAAPKGGTQPAGARFTLDVRVEPPRYTGLPASAVPVSERGTVEPIEILTGSHVTLRILPEGPAPAALIWNVPGARPERFPLPAAGVVRSWELRADLAIRIETTDRDPFSRLLLFRARADRPPDVELLSPAEDQTLRSAPAAFTVEALARDDFGVASGTLRYTLAHGRGEGMTFKNGTLPAASRSESENGLRLTSRFDPKALGFGLGDTLVLWAEASDRNDVTGPGLTRSSPRVVRWEDPTSTLDMPRSASRALAREAPLSERELLKRTRRLVSASLSAAARREKALDLAEQQRGIRLRFAVFTRQEDADSTAVLDVETEETNPFGPPKQERLLAQAVDGMWRAERALSAGEPAGAVAPEQDAIRLLEEAFGLERVSLNALAAPSAGVDLEKRLTGEAKGLKPSPDALPDDPEVRARRAEARLLARFLDEAALAGPLSARTIGDRVFAGRALPGFDPPAEAAGLYAARDEAELRRRARTLALRLLELLDGIDALALPASTKEGAVTRWLEGAAPPRSRR